MGPSCSETSLGDRAFLLRAQGRTPEIVPFCPGILLGAMLPVFSFESDAAKHLSAGIRRSGVTPRVGLQLAMHLAQWRAVVVKL